MDSPFKAVWFPSIITEHDIKVFRGLYQIPDSVTLRVPGPDQFASRPRDNEVAFNEELFLLGARLPLQPYFAAHLHGFEIPPYQLNLNGWRTISGLYVIWVENKPPLTIEEIKYLFLIKKRGPSNMLGFIIYRPEQKMIYWS